MTTKKIEKHLLPSSSLGCEKSITVIRYGKENTGRKVYIQAGLHADEPPGGMALHYLMDLLDRADSQNLIKDQIVIVPFANPLGLSQWNGDVLLGRFENVNGVNFNRNHIDLVEPVAEDIQGKLSDDPEKNIALIRQSMKETLEGMDFHEEGSYLKWLLLSLSYDADIVLDLHCDCEAVLHVYTGTPLWPEGADLSAQMGAVITLLEKNSGSNPYDEACSRIWWDLAEKFPAHPIPSACFSATVEFRGIADVNHEYGKLDGGNLFYFLQRRGYIGGGAPELPELINDATPLSGVEHVKADRAGIVVYLKKPGEWVNSGDVVAQIIDPAGETLESRVTDVQCATSGTLFSTRYDRFARPGMILVKIAGDKPIEGKGANLLTI